MRNKSNKPRKKRTRPSHPGRQKARKGPAKPSRSLDRPKLQPSSVRTDIEQRPRRLNKILSAAGLTSRRTADEWLESGRITVNGRLVTKPGTQAIWGSDIIKVDGNEIPKPSERIYLLLNKPFGYMCSLHDPEGRPLVIDLLKDITQRVYPVGRLDFDTLGLLLITNDGEWAHRLMHPRYRIPRTYKATISGEITDEAVNFLKKGIKIEDGPKVKAGITVIHRDKSRSILRITISHGKNRQVRRMLEAVGYNIVHLIRTAFGKLTLGDLKIGEYRHLETTEVESMKKTVGMD